MDLSEGPRRLNCECSIILTNSGPQKISLPNICDSWIFDERVDPWNASHRRVAVEKFYMRMLPKADLSEAFGNKPVKVRDSQSATLL
jgi:hypothetical protein